ncbi:MAG: Fe-S cluster assembly protein NifU [Kiritimatiellae bacterium]|nr:Fe-S cluster assembly protein NifU [Kiritimatiellia bacterium]
MWDYTDKVKDHFLHPRNIGVVENPDGVGMEGSLACGDALKISFKLDADKRISEAKFQTFGCASAIASASILTEMMLGKSIEEAAKITNQDIVNELGGLPKEKIHCSVMGQEALEAAIAYYRNGGKPEEKQSQTGRLVCNCFGITETEIVDAILSGHLTTVEQVTEQTKAGSGCGSCLDDIEEILKRVTTEMQQKEEDDQAMTNIEKIEKIKNVIETVIRPALQHDGGDIKLIDVVGDVVKVQLQGACAGCPMSAMTLSHFVEQQLKEQVSESITLEAVRP